jgi:glycolate oxidase FAD binding subunit
MWIYGARAAVFEHNEESMSVLEPDSVGELMEQLRASGERQQALSVCGHDTKRSMAGPISGDARVLTTRRLCRVLQYEPRDLTISVEAGHPFQALQELLAQNGQMIALDPPFSSSATIGGVVATNGSGPMRRGYGTARDLVIGMKFVTVEGKLVETGGMVVKNVAGLDMGKVLIGSFGTLAVISSINFRLHSIPEATATFLYSCSNLDQALDRRTAILGGVLQPVAIDLLSPALAMSLGRRGFVLAVRAAGTEPAVRRYLNSFSDAETLEGESERVFWQQIREAIPDFLARQPEGVIIRVSTALDGLRKLPNTVAGWFLARAGSGVAYFFFPSWAPAASWWRRLEEMQFPAVVEFAPDPVRRHENCWIAPPTIAEKHAMAMMEKMKQMFDPHGLLNKGRLYGRI